LRNLNSAEGLSNGTRLVCRRFSSNIIEAEISNGQHKGKRVFLPRIPFLPLETQQNPFAFKRTQFPIRLCFAMTINKAQGQTLDFVGLYLPQPVFSHGQLYVALSRAREKKSVKVLLSPESTNVVFGCTKNIVFQDVLKLAGCL
jgi:ATP-dependent DNA helicase PIF1